MNSLQLHLETNHANKSSAAIKSLVYGGVDGIITTFSIISASYGTSLDYNLTIILALSNLFADAWSMGLGDFISSNLERNYIQAERHKEIHEYEHNLEEEVKELIEIYKLKGLQR